MDWQTAQQTIAELPEHSPSLGARHLFQWTRLSVEQIMTREVITLSPEASLRRAAEAMGEAGISCLVITENATVVGIITQKDLMRVAHQGPAAARRIGEVMSGPVVSVPPETSVLCASMTLERETFKRLPVTAGDRLVGIVSQTDLVRAFESMSVLRSVTEIMTRDPVVVRPDATVGDAVDRMVERRISCVVVARGPRPEGVLTEKDVLRTVLARGHDPRTTPIVDVMTFPVVTVSPGHSVLSASRLMDERRIHRLVVCEEDGTLAGVVTRTDVLNGLQNHAQRTSHETLHLLTHASDAIFMLDPQGRLTYVNPLFVRLFQADTAEPFLDRPFPPDALWIDPAEGARLQAACLEDTKGIEKGTLRTVTGESLSLGWCLTALRDADGTVVGRQGVIWDLSRDAV